MAVEEWTGASNSPHLAFFGMSPSYIPRSSVCSSRLLQVHWLHQQTNTLVVDVLKATRGQTLDEPPV